MAQITSPGSEYSGGTLVVTHCRRPDSPGPHPFVAASDHPPRGACGTSANSRDVGVASGDWTPPGLSIRRRFVIFALHSRAVAI